MTFVNVKHTNKAAPFVMFGMAVMFASYSGQFITITTPVICRPTRVSIGASIVTAVIDNGTVSCIIDPSETSVDITCN